ncbi:ASCH domain-containing protein [Marinifilum caeruleilacunae]|jgi:hypothetical protein|uniref:ASCH domain-containing protein n=1 Tax=Marinifilum caeruleilacunae TaxID=2499076 RepID=A0ABX1WRE3_9BACT|nr:ASCH domain-containing protein [Marinifilum caeruleilacunae]NOU58638.1 ASCH domain-containing protein [Marinifilum caeruleilacunae]
MSKIHFHSDFYEDIKNGYKTQTARFKEAAPELGRGEAIFDDKPPIPIDITKVKYKKFESLNREEVQKDGFNSKTELWSVLVGFYPQLKPTDPLLLIEFKPAE